MIENPASYSKRDLYRQPKSVHQQRFETAQIFRQFQLLMQTFGHTVTMDQSEGSDDPYVPILSLMYDKSGQLIFTGDEMGLIKIWSSQTGFLLSNMKGHTKMINAMEVSYCNKYLASCSGDGTVRIWSIYDGKPVAVLKHKDNEPMGLVMWYNNKVDESTSNQYLVTVSDSGFIYMYTASCLPLPHRGLPVRGSSAMAALPSVSEAGASAQRDSAGPHILMFLYHCEQQNQQLPRRGFHQQPGDSG